MFADLRSALRQLRKAPGVTVTALATLALGIGPTTELLPSVPRIRKPFLVLIFDQINATPRRSTGACPSSRARSCSMWAAERGSYR